MNQATLKGFQMLANSMPKVEISLTVRNKENFETIVKGEYNPLTNSVSVGRIVCSEKELHFWLKMIYNVTLISIGGIK